MKYQNSRRVIPTMVLIFLAVLFCQESIAQKFAIESVNVVDVVTGNLAKNQTILVVDGVIQVIFYTKRRKAFDGYTSIDGKNQYVIPGLMDAHAHLPGPQGLDMPLQDYMLMQLANGVTKLRCMRYEEEHLEVRKQVEQGEIIGPSLLLPAPAISVYSSIDYTNADRLFAQYQSMGYDHIKYLNGLNPATHKSLCALAKKYNLPFVGHLPSYVGLENGLNAGQNGVEHFNGYTSLFEGNNMDQLDELILLSKQKSVFNCPTIDWYNANTPLIANASEVLPLRRGLEFLPDSLVNRWHKQLKEATEQKEDVATNSRFEVLKRFKMHDAPLLVSPGDGNFIVPGFSMMEEMKIFSQAGFANQEILKAATYNGALFYGKSSKFGSISEGLEADIVLLQKNPLESLSHMNLINGVMVRGQWYSREFLDGKLASMRQ